MRGWHSQGGGPEALDIIIFNYNYLPYIIAEFSAINKRENYFTKIVLSRASTSDYATE